MNPDGTKFHPEVCWPTQRETDTTSNKVEDNVMCYVVMCKLLNMIIDSLQEFAKEDLLVDADLKKAYWIADGQKVAFDVIICHSYLKMLILFQLILYQLTADTAGDDVTYENAVVLIYTYLPVL